MKRLSPTSTYQVPSPVQLPRSSSAAGPRPRAPGSVLFDNGASPLRNNPIGTDPWLNLPPTLILTGFLSLPEPDGRPAVLRALPTPSLPRPPTRLPDWRGTLHQEQRSSPFSGRPPRRSEFPHLRPAPFPRVGPTSNHSRSSPPTLLWRTGSHGSPSRLRKANFIFIGRKTSSCAPDWARKGKSARPLPIITLPGRLKDSREVFPTLASSKPLSL